MPWPPSAEVLARPRYRPLRAAVRSALAAAAARVPEPAVFVVAFSGGADSLALLYLVRHCVAAAACGRAHVEALHVHHGTGEQADDHAAFCRRACAALSVPLHLLRVRPEDLATAAGRGREAAWRSARRRLFEDHIRGRPERLLVLAHTREDQAETLLGGLLFRGGPPAMAGMRTLAGPYVRPLLDVSRGDLRRLLVDLGQEWCEDGSNRDTTLLRPWLRRRLLPAIVERNPGIVERLAQLTAIFQEEDAFLRAELDRQWPRLLDPPFAGEALALNLDRVAALAPALRRRALWRAARVLTGGGDWSARHLLAAESLLTDPGRGQRDLNLPGQWVLRRTGGRLEFWRTAALEVQRAQCRALARWTIPLRPPQRVELPAGAWVPPWPRPLGRPGCLCASFDDAARTGERCQRVLIPTEMLDPIELRTRRRGDRLFGIDGPRGRLSRFLMAQQIPRSRRDRLPLLAHGHRVLWIGGLALPTPNPTPGRDVRAIAISLLPCPADDTLLGAHCTVLAPPRHRDRS